MLPIISKREGDRIKIEMTVDLSGFMLEADNQLQIKLTSKDHAHGLEQTRSHGSGLCYCKC